MAVHSAVACSEVKDDGLLVPWQLMECILFWVVSSSLAVGDSFLFVTDKSLYCWTLWANFSYLVCLYEPLTSTIFTTFTG